MSRRSTRSMPALFALALLAALARPAFAQRGEPPKFDEDDLWQVIYIGENRIGYSHFKVERDEENGRRIVRTANDTQMKIVRFNQTLKIHTTLTTVEKENGDLIRFSYDMRNPPAAPTRTVGVVKGKHIELEHTVNGRTQKSTIPVTSDVKSPAYPDRALTELSLKPNDRASLKAFALSFNKVGRVKFSADRPRTVDLLGGKRRKLLKVTMYQSVAPTLKTRYYLDERGIPIRSDMDFMGLSMVSYTVPKGTALEEIAGAELDLAVQSLVRTVRIRKAHETKKAVYRIKHANADPSKFLIDEGNQSVRKISEHEAELTVTALRPKASVRIVKADKKYTAASRYLQIRDRNVVRHARRAAGAETDPWRAAVKMEKYVSRKLLEKNFSTALASAAEVAEDMQGDCTEHAVLLAAMLRAKRVPSRLCVGLVYIDRESAFGGHMWTEAFIGGKWIPLDATLGNGGIGAAHIKLAQSSFADSAAEPATAFLPLLNVLGKMEIEVVSVD